MVWQNYIRMSFRLMITTVRRSKQREYVLTELKITQKLKKDVDNTISTEKEEEIRRCNHLLNWLKRLQSVGTWVCSLRWTNTISKIYSVLDYTVIEWILNVYNIYINAVF